MNLRQLESFLAVAEEGTFTRAAARLGIAQPSLSQQIRTLETELGGELFERLPRSARLTAAGKALVPDAHVAVRAAERAAGAARAALGLTAGELEVATVLSMAVGILPRAIEHWHADHPDVAIRMREYTHRNLLEDDVRNGVADVAIGPLPVGWPGPVAPLGWEEMVLVIPHADPLAARPAVRLEQLSERRWVLFLPGHGLAEVVTAACRRAGFEPRPGVRTSQVEAAVRLAAAGVGPAMVPDNALSTEVGAAVVHVEPPVVRRLAAFTRTQWPPLAREFLPAVRQTLHQRRPPGAIAVG
jgi:DNA-binding transcriptional LysR family regulator